MRNSCFLILSCTVILVLSSCTKENLLDPSTSGNITQNPYSTIHSEWTGIETFAWEDGTTSTTPTQEAAWSVPALTRDLLDMGSTVLLFAKSRDTDEIQAVPVAYVSGPTDNIVDFYDTQVDEGNIFFMHTKTVDGNPEVPTDLNNVSLRYIIITEQTDAFGRTPVTDFRSMSYIDLVKKLNIPE